MWRPEQTVQCPACWEQFLVPLDPEPPSREEVIDCEICCRPMVLTVQDGQIVSVESES